MSKRRFNFYLFLAIGFFCVIDVLAQQKVEFRDIADKYWQGTIKKFDQQGFELETMEGITLKFDWDELAEEDARRIKFQLGVELTITPKKVVKEGTLGDFKGVKLILKKDPERVIYGVIVAEGTDALNVTIKSRGKNLKYSRDEIKSISEETISAREVFDDAQLYNLILELYKPAKAEEHLKVADVCREYELFDKAEYHFQLAEIAMTPHRPESKIIQMIEAIQEKHKDEKLIEYLYIINKDIVNRRYDEALQMLEKTEKLFARPEFTEFYKSIRQELNSLISRKLEEKVVDYYEAMLMYYLRTTAVDRRKSFSMAVDFVARDMQREILKKISSHLEIDERSAIEIWNKRVGKENKTSYGSGSWIIEAPKAGNPDEWWESANNFERLNFLTSYFAERFMKVIRVAYKDCSECGGEGKIFAANCSYCKGVGKIRIVHYK